MMIMAPQKKKLATIVIERMGKKPSFVQSLGEESQPDGMESQEAEQDDSIALETIAEDIIKAIKSDNVKELALCLKDFFVMVDDEEDMEEEASEEGDMSGENEPLYSRE